MLHPYWISTVDFNGTFMGPQKGKQARAHDRQTTDEKSGQELEAQQAQKQQMSR